MKTKLGALILLGMSSGIVHADITTNGTHVSTNVNQREEYYINVNTTASDNIYIQSQVSTTPGFSVADGNPTYFDGYLSLWQETGSNWTLVAENDNAPRTSLYGPTTIYGQSVLGWTSADVYGQGQADPGLKYTLQAGSTYLIVQSEANDAPIGTTFANPSAAIGLQIPVGSSLTNYFQGLDDQTGGGGQAYNFTNNYTLTVTGANAAFTSAPTVNAVPVPGAVWLFGSMLAGFGLIRKQPTV
jgi:hypothetical protein